jgi:lantibiotic modifying enzyme
MSLAVTHGIEVSGMKEAIVQVSEWLLEHRLDDEWGINWPTAIPVSSSLKDEVSTTRPASLRPSRSAWCYGSPGVARALWLAGNATNNRRYSEVAVSAMEAVFRRPIKQRFIDSPTFCHGVAGLQEVTLRFANDTGLPLFLEATRNLEEQLLASYEDKSTLGYRNLEPGNRKIDQPGLLDGAPGVAMVLLAASSKVAPSWDRIFLLS